MWVIARLQTWHGVVNRLICKQPRKLDRHGIGVQPAQVDGVCSCCSSDDLSPQHSPSLIEGVQQPADPVIIELIGLVYVGIQSRNLILGGPPGHIIERAWIRQSALDHQLRHQAVVEIGLLSHRTQPIDRLTQAQTTQKWGGED